MVVMLKLVDQGVGGLVGYYLMIWIKSWGLLRPVLAGRESVMMLEELGVIGA